AGGVFVLIAVVLFTEQIGAMPTFDKTSESARLARIPAPPPECRVFFADHRPSLDRPFYAFQTDAGMIAAITGLPTINGYSSNFPPGWHFLFHTRPGYSAAVADWVLAHDLLAGLCSLDLEHGEWRKIEPMPPRDLRG